ncbi:MAG TPA: enoyl-CoA hydratase-related protein [Candidatus Eisenbacteria bacterium]|nr:enoyl-CoA hydratase-related protein [Candidatus Eisenbacteria bacterium]
MGVVVEQRERVALVILDRPPLNVLNIEIVRELDATLESLARTPGIDAIVLRGAGERAFSAGVDIGDHTREKVPEMLDSVHGVMRKLLELPQVTVASVRGLCLGGGCELAASCDLLVASEDSSFATPEIRVGCYPPVALARFSSLVGYHRAAEMILTGRRFSAREALEIGLVNRVSSAERLQETLETLLQELLESSGAVLRIAARGLRELALANFANALKRAEALYSGELLRTEDVEEGVRAFMEKRKPRWKHR